MTEPLFKDLLLSNDNTAAATKDAAKDSSEAEGWRSRSSLIMLLLMTAFPFSFFDLFDPTLDGWKKYIDHLTESRIAGIIQWLPFILIMALQNHKERIAIWTAFGVGCFVALIEYLHSTYKPIYASFYWLTWFNLLTFLGMGIAYEITKFDWQLIGAITVSSLLLAAACSLLVRNPFTMQFARPQLMDKGLDAFVESPYFYKMNVFLTLIWLVIFTIMTVCSWLASLLGSSLGAGELILGTIVPIVLPIAGMLLMPVLGKMWKDRNIPNNANIAAKGKDCQNVQEKKKNNDLNV